MSLLNNFFKTQQISAAEVSNYFASLFDKRGVCSYFTIWAHVESLNAIFVRGLNL